jgi:hypothetical protein
MVQDAEHPEMLMDFGAIGAPATESLVAEVGSPLLPFNFMIYHKPEPTALALLSLGGLVGLLRRR